MLQNLELTYKSVKFLNRCVEQRIGNVLRTISKLFLLAYFKESIWICKIQIFVRKEGKKITVRNRNFVPILHNYGTFKKLFSYLQ